LNKFKTLTKYIEKLSNPESFGEWVIDHKNDGSPEHPTQLPFVKYKKLVHLFVKEFDRFSISHKEYDITNYSYILKSNGIKLDGESIKNMDIDSLNAQCALALIMCAINAERFCDGVFLRLLKDGFIVKWLKRLKDIDDSSLTTDII